jgi:hypothetical protein
VFCVETRPILLASRLPDSEILVDGEPFLSGFGSRLLRPWRTEYEIEVRTPSKVVRRTIYPWGPESDSGSVIVEKSGTTFNLDSRPVAVDISRE